MAATRLYLRAATPATLVADGEHSTALPVGTVGGATSGSTQERRSLSTSKGAAETSHSFASLAQTAHQDTFMGRFASGTLAAQTIAAATWTFACDSIENNTNANSFYILSVYVWRPGTSSVVGFIYDSDTTLGVEWASGVRDGQVVTFSGSSVTAQAGDLLVLEVWRHAVQGSTTTANQIIRFDGTTDVTDLTSTDAASYLECPNTISFGTTFNQSVSVGVTLTPAISRQTLKAVSLGATLTAAVTRRTLKAVSAGATLTAAVVRVTQKAIAATLTVTLTVVRQTVKSAIAVTVTTTAAVARSTGKAVSASVAVTVSVVRQTLKLVSAGATLAAAVARSTGKTVAAGITLAVDVTRSTGKAVAAGVQLGLSVARQTAKTVGADVLLALGVARSTAKQVVLAITANPAVRRVTSKVIGLATTIAITVGQLFRLPIRLSEGTGAAPPGRDATGSASGVGGSGAASSPDGDGSASRFEGSTGGSGLEGA